jgi:alkylhydroperoxidase/carboxymuconolactone decarboxylase family protein YurZ
MFFIKTTLALTLLLACVGIGLNAQPTNTMLDKKHAAIVPIAAFMAKGDLLQLRSALHKGLDAGLSVAEIKEVLVQLYAYTGFPRSLNALNTFMAVLEERKAQGIHDDAGKSPQPLPADQSKRALGTEIQTKLVGQPIKGAVYEFSPEIDLFLKEHLFADIFGRDNLDFKSREIATIAALAALGGAEPQLRSHLNVGLYNGISPSEMQHLVAVLRSKVGAKESDAVSDLFQASVLQKSDGATPIAANDYREVVVEKGALPPRRPDFAGRWRRGLLPRKR